LCQLVKKLRVFFALGGSPESIVFEQVRYLHGDE
jgi:hypothetical protein